MKYLPVVRAAAAALMSLTLLVGTASAQTLPDITAIQTEVLYGGNRLTLALKGTTRPNIAITKEGTSTVIELKEAFLNVATAPGKVYSLVNPLPGVSTLEAKQTDLRTVRVVLTSISTAPEVSIDLATPVSLRLIVGGGYKAGIISPKQTETTVADLRSPDRPDPAQNRTFSARAVAPPTGDIAIAPLNVDPPVKLGSSDSITLFLKDAPVREVLSLMARRAGVNVIFNGDVSGKTVSVDVQGEPLEQTFNLILRLAGLNAQKIDKTVVVGAQLPQDLLQTSAKTFRLNQANVAQVLPQIQGLMGQLQETIYASTDARTNALTLVGTPRALKVAAAQIAQLDVRQRQVLVSLKLVDINLLDTDNLGVGFGYQLGNFVFGSQNIGGVGAATNFLTRSDTGNSSTTNLTTGETLPGGAPTLTRLNVGSVIGPTGVNNNFVGTFDSTLDNLSSELQTRLEASIQAGASRVLADPKIVLEAGVGVTQANTAKVDITDDVIVGTKITVDPATGLTTTSVEKDKAGVILDVSVFNIDDNGYVNLAVKPLVSSIISEDRDASGNIITLLSRRELDIKRVRIRDGQTIVLAGLLNDQDIVTTSKVPFLGDLPLVGALFRTENVTRQKREVALMLTPFILKDPAEQGVAPVSLKP